MENVNVLFFNLAFYKQASLFTNWQKFTNRLWWVSSTPFRVPFHVLVRFRNRGIISIIICKWSVQKTFQQHFSIISKSVCYDFYLKRNVAFTLISFDVLKWDDCLSVQVPFELPVQLLLEPEANWLDQNVNLLEFELPRM